MAADEYFVPEAVADALDALKAALDLFTDDKRVILTDEYLHCMGMAVSRSEKAQLTTFRLVKPVDPQLDPLLARATADPEGRALVTAILERKELSK